MELTDLCTELRNWFETTKCFGTFTINDGELAVADLVAGGFLQNGQYYRIVGSVFNDGVYKYDEDESPELTDEVFEGAIWPMAVPPAVIDLSKRISDWIDEYGKTVSSPYSSESFGGYSYTKASSGQGNAFSSDSPTWQSTFATELSRWRKI